MMHSADLPMDHASQPPAAPRNLLLMVIWGALSLILWLGVAGQMVFIVPRFEKLFADFKMKTPLMTQWVIVDFWWVVPAFAVAVLLACLATRSRWAWLFLLILLPVIVNALIGVSLCFPYMDLLEGLGGK
jgi:heme/copper-type cytochrome/quinol oxidase subunit 2